MEPLLNENDVERVLDGAGMVLIFKHSVRCPVSLDAYNEVQRFALAHPDVEVYLLDVVRDRALSRRLAERTGVVHQSPQVILLRDGTIGWSGSHYAVTARELSAQLAALAVA